MSKASVGGASEGRDAPSGDVKVDDLDCVYVAEGDIVAGKYRVERVIGVGGTGFVVAARHLELDGDFALKFLKKRFLRDPLNVERFTREAKAACRIRSEYVARVYDVGSSRGVPFLVMDHLVGRDLGAVLADTGWLGVDDAVGYMIEACVALTVAHGHGIVHRDIKPENLFLVEHEDHHSVKLLDFGISKVALVDSHSQLTAARLTGSLVLGTPLYMSPEQIRSTAAADPPSDVWSLGVVLYELLTATAAFQADSVAEVLAAVLAREPRPLAELRPDLPEGLCDVVVRCLQKDPARRFGTVAELAVALLPYAPARALAVAESSSSIRHAAILALGANSLASSTHPGLAQRTSGAVPVSGAQRVTATQAPQHSLQRGTRGAPNASWARLAIWTGAGVVISAVLTGALAVHGRAAINQKVGTEATGPSVPKEVLVGPKRFPSPPRISDDPVEPAIPATKSTPGGQVRPPGSAPSAIAPKSIAARTVPATPSKPASADSTTHGIVTSPVAVAPLVPSRAHPDLGY
ncbi:MAG: protein kinase [Myxococcota bacterium]|nr:protein kinase [Myxococcota bacterium]